MNSNACESFKSINRHLIEDAKKDHSNTETAFLQCWHETAGHFEDTPVGICNADLGRQWLLRQGYDTLFVMDVRFKIITH